MAENDEGSTPTEDELLDWADTHLGDAPYHPVVADPGWGVGSRFEADGGIPSLTLLGPGAVVITADGWIDASDIEAALP